MKWKQIPQFPNYYASDTGLIKNQQGHIMSTTTATSTDKHQKVKLYTNGIRTTQFVHRLILMAFNPNPNYHNLEVNHIDGNPANNNLSNLEWCTGKENHQHYKEIIIPQRRINGTLNLGAPQKYYYYNNSYYIGYDMLIKNLELSKTHIWRWISEGKIQIVNNIPTDAIINKYQPIEKKSIPRIVCIYYWKKPNEYYNNCKEADKALGLPSGTINRWIKRNWNKVNSGKVTQLGIKKIEYVDNKKED